MHVNSGTRLRRILRTSGKQITLKNYHLRQEIDVCRVVSGFRIPLPTQRNLYLGAGGIWENLYQMNDGPYHN